MSEMREGTPEWALAYMEDAARHTLLDEGSGTKELRKAVKIIATALAEAEARGRRQGPAWQPIESAPKDGTYILVSDGSFSDVARFSHGSFGGFRAPDDATHWMPLPAPPFRATAPAETQKPEETA